MRAVSAKVVADLRRRRLQAAVLAVVLFLAGGAATFALDILVASNEPFERAFAAANGAHLVVDFRGSLDRDAVAATAGRSGLTGSAGPWPVAVGSVGRPDGGVVFDQRLSARPDPLGPVDRIDVAAGRWWRTDGEAVVSWDTAQLFGLRVGDGLAVYAATAPGTGDGGPILLDPGGKPTAPSDPLALLTVVGIARSVSTPDIAAWMSPSVVADVAGDATPSFEMLYRIGPRVTDADLAAAVARITDGLPVDAVVGSHTYLETRMNVNDTAQLYVPILLAFSAFALIAAAFTIANVVSGIVLTSYREIGVMKAVGYTPAQVTAVLEAQTLLPVLVGSLAGVTAGTLASVSTVERLTLSFGLPPSFTFSPVVVVGVVATCLTIAALAAAVPAIQAGRVSAARAIASGSAASTAAGGGLLHRLGMRLPFGAPVRLGVAAAGSHPVRATMTLGAVVVGVAAATFAVGVNLSLVRIMDQLDRTQASPVRAQLRQPATDASAVTAAIAGNPDTARYVAIGQAQVTARGLGELPFVGYDGDSAWLGYEAIHGRWPAGPGEVVAPTSVFRRSGLAIGDQLEVAGRDGSTTVTLVGEIFDTADSSSGHLVLRGSIADLRRLDPAATIDQWEVQPRSGVQPAAYAAWLENATGGGVGAYTIDDSTADEEFLLFLSVVATLGAVLVAIALGGVFNTVLLETRQRTRELAVLKALGMGPRQVVAMVIASVALVGLVAGIVGVPIGLALQRAVLSYMGETVANLALPESSYDVFGPLLLAGLALGGLAIAAVGAWLPAQRAARMRIAPVLQAE